MDEKVVSLLKASFAADLYETVDAAKKTKDEKNFRHTMFENSSNMVFCALFPKADILQIPDLTDEFKVQLKTFNVIGVITDATQSLELFMLGGMNKPLTTLKSAEALSGILDEGQIVGFLDRYFKTRGFEIDLETVSVEELIERSSEETLQNTSFSRLQEIDKMIQLAETDDLEN